ncbi:hypothetical protein RN001_006701 [Aquatica leii]|uniref:DNA-directed DNA polymerase n=1 Tax=Aquatica leii TaxID=1421715 RepID=A0AAN7SIR3_9COLE|nr:hypothetical protein RN001_006701 [Aquatica leii]
MVGITLTNPNYPEKLVSISFRRMDQFKSSIVLTVLEKIMQSNAQFFAHDVLTMQMDKVRLPLGCGRKTMSGMPFDEFSIRKKGIITVVNNDKDCLAYALVLAIAYKTRDPEFNNMVLNKSILHTRVQNLCIESEVNLSQGGSYREIQKLQNYLTGYTIVVYNSRRGETTYFEGPRSDLRITLNLLLENNHFNVITSLTSAFTAAYFCEYCKKRFNNKRSHKRCLYTCSACHESPPCSYENEKLHCNACFRDFYGAACIENHRKTKLCAKLIRCRLCLHTVWVTKKTEHKCGFTYCRLCFKLQPLQHFCYMTPDNPRKELKQKKSFLFIFYDIESRQETLFGKMPNSFIHEPNLCISAHVCSVCINNENMMETCEFCGKRINVFKGKNSIKSFLSFVAKQGMKFKVTAIAHNMKGYDGCFILRQMLIDKDAWNPKIISNGLKLISISSDNVRFIDSLNYLPLPLSKLPKTFDIPESKGYFPHLFNKKENENYNGPLPDIKFYDHDQMNTEDREKFLNWYSENKSKNYVFNMNNEILKYCTMDVNILLKACLKFWQFFLVQNGVDCFQEATTIASACNLVFRRRYLKPNSIGLIPAGGYRLADKQSYIALKWLLWLEHSLGISIQHSAKAREHRLREGILVDGYCTQTNTVYEFHGCFWHGCERCFPVQVVTDGDCNSNSDKTGAMFLRREHTEARSKRIKSLGYPLVEIWECQFREFLKINADARAFVENLNILKQEPLNPRDSFYGGRTNAVKLYYKCEEVNEKICYFDVCSLYPYVNKYCKYPIGHPIIHIGHETCSKLPIDTVEGLIKCLVLPPQNLYHPVLPYRLHNKLMFILCRTCAESLNQEECYHNDTDRSFVGTYVADELRKAVSLNYKILELFEIWEYKIEQYSAIGNTNGLFSGYINNFLKLKQECSGWPQNCTTDIEKDSYIQEYYLKESIQLDKHSINKNPGLRYLAKLMLNSFWGKFGQRENLPQTSIISNPADFFKLLVAPDKEVHSIVPVGDEVIVVNWNNRDECSKQQTTVNVVIAAYTTAHARLELYKYLEKLNKRPGEWIPETGEFLGQMTDELQAYGNDSFITEFVSGGPKNYSFNVYSPEKKTNSTICKVKGLSLNYANSKVINFKKMRDIIFNDDTEHLYLINDRKIVRTKMYDVISRPERKIYKTVYNKRRRLRESYDTLPYGFKVIN